MRRILTELPRTRISADCALDQQNLASRSLAWFRIGLAAVLLVQALGLIGALNDLFSRHGPVGWYVTWVSPPVGLPTVEWFERALSIAGMPARLGAPLALAAYVASLIGLLAGYRTRWFAFLAWFAHTALITSSHISNYGVDRFAHIGLFYCMVFPVGRTFSYDARWSQAAAEPSIWPWLGWRTLQAHVCIMYTASGIEKASGIQWWNGEAVWRAIMGAPMDSPIDCSFLAYSPWIAQFAGWMTLVLEAGVLAFVWHPRSRRLWLVGMIGMHLSIALLMGLWTFSAVMIVYDLSAFGGIALSRSPVSGAAGAAQFPNKAGIFRAVGLHVGLPAHS
jgi:hypothetical protein